MPAVLPLLLRSEELGHDSGVLTQTTLVGSPRHAVTAAAYRASMAVLIGRGMYDVVEAARLVRMSPGTIESWVRPTKTRPALIEPELGDYFSFLDLVSLLVVAELRRRGVKPNDIARGVQYLGQEMGLERPLAHRDFATVGAAFWGRRWTDDLWVDVGRGGQMGLLGTFEQSLQPIEFDAQDMAALWRPIDRIWVNPEVQAGSPCIDRTRFETRQVLELVDGGTDPADIAWQFLLEYDDVLTARDWERSLTRAA